jgi:hypothetical protein
MLLVDENMIIAHANNAIEQILHKNYSQIINHRLGNALGCINSTNSNKRYGFGRACEKCPLKKAISSVLDSGQSVQELKIHPTLKAGSKKIKPWLCISIERVIIDSCSCLIIAVEDITHSKKPENIHTTG